MPDNPPKYTQHAADDAPCLDDNESRRKSQLINVALWVWGSVMLIFVLIHFFQSGYYHLGVLYLLGLGIVLGIWGYFRRSGNVTVTAIWVTGLITVVIGGFLHLTQDQFYAFAWMLPVPVVAISLLGSRWGLVWSFLWSVYFGVYMATQMAAWSPAAFHYGSIVNILTATLLVALLVAHYARSYHRLAISLLDKNQELARVTVTDTLTQLLNRYALDKNLTRMMSKCGTENCSISLILLDIDAFKQINDTHGHARGDEVLCFLAEIIQNSVRRDDIAGRWGGDEFMVICPETDLGMARTIAERICQQVNDYAVIPFSVSAGVAGCMLNDQTKALLVRADEGLYRAKRSGGNQVIASQAE